MKPSKAIDSIILTVRAQRVILDTDLAELYGVPTRALNQALKRNVDRFPEDFAFRLTGEENLEVITNCYHLTKLKYSAQASTAFTEHGAIMAATILNSTEAVAMSIFVVEPSSK